VDFTWSRDLVARKIHNCNWADGDYYFSKSFDRCLLVLWCLLRIRPEQLTFLFRLADNQQNRSRDQKGKIKYRGFLLNKQIKSIVPDWFLTSIIELTNTYQKILKNNNLRQPICNYVFSSLRGQVTTGSELWVKHKPSRLNGMKILNIMLFLKSPRKPCLNMLELGPSF